MGERRVRGADHRGLNAPTSRRTAASPGPPGPASQRPRRGRAP